jgi:hypothetical protein
MSGFPQRPLRRQLVRERKRASLDDDAAWNAGGNDGLDRLLERRGGRKAGDDRWNSCG